MEIRENEVLLFQGDSITDGNRGRSEDLNHIMGHGYQFICAAALHLENYTRGFRAVNRGESGDTLPGLAARWERDALAFRPTMLSILIGTNDIGRAFGSRTIPDGAAFRDDLAALVERTRAENPTLRTVLMEPFRGLKFPDPEKLTWYETCQPILSDAVRQAAEATGSLFLPLQDLLADASVKAGDPFAIIWDGIHPTITGHALIAEAWLKLVREADDR